MLTAVLSFVYANIKCIIVHEPTYIPFILSHRKFYVKVYSFCLIGGFELSEY